MKNLLVLLFAGLCLTASSIPFEKNLQIPAINGEKDKTNELLATRSFKFRKNMGQMRAKNQTLADRVLYSCKVQGMDLYVTTEGLRYFFYKEIEPKKLGTFDPRSNLVEATCKIQWERIEMVLEGAQISSKNIIENQESSESYNYFTAAYPDGICDVKEYGAITIRNVYPGIDWVLYNSDKTGFKYDFVVHFGADASLIQLKFQSISPIEIDQSGVLHLQTKFGSLTELAPYSYVKENHEKIKSAYKITSNIKNDNIYETIIAYQLENGNSSNKTIVIDPVLFWATTYGGTFNDRPKSIETDNSGNIFITGLTQSTDFILQNASTYFQGTGNSNGKIFIMKFSPSDALIWSSYYGGSSSETGFSVAVDSLQNIIVSGNTYSSDFPTQNSGAFFQGSTGGGNCDAFLLKFNNNGTRLWATYFGGNDLEWGISVNTDKNGNIFMGGITYSPNFPLLNAGTFFYGTPPPQGNDVGFITKFSKTGSLLWSTYYLSDRINAITTDDTGNLYVTGFTYNITHTMNPGGGAFFQPTGTQTESFIGKFDNTGNLLWATYYGGNKDDYGYSLVTDHAGNVFLSGITRSNNLLVVGEGDTFLYSMPTTTPSIQTDAFIAKFDNAGLLKWATYYGSTGYDQMSTFDNLEIDDCGRLYVSFESSATGTNSTNVSLMPSCESGYYKNIASNYDQLVARFSNTGAMQWATLMGGDGSDVGSALAVDKNGDLYVTGTWDATSLSTYTAVNPGSGAYMDNNLGTSAKGFISKFTNASIRTAPAYSYATVCSSEAGFINPIKSSSFLIGGTFSAPNLSINPLTGVINVANVAPGTYSVYYIVEQCQCIQSVASFDIQNCDGIKDMKESSQKIKVYPNPNAGTFTLKSENSFTGQLMNELGQTVLLLNLNSENENRQIISNLPSGVYLAKSAKGNIFYKIVVLE